MVQLDKWLSQYFSPKEAYRYLSPFEVAELPKGFIDAKVGSDDLDSLQKLVSQGFDIVETALIFEQKKIVNESQNSLLSFRLAVKDDEKAVLGIAEDAFTSSRFYQDPNISKEIASKIKRDWVANYFSNERGTHMIISEGKNGEIAGFMLLIDKTIDLIATSPFWFRQGVGLGMIAFANQNMGSLLRAGTQSINKASINFYQKAGFILEKTQFVLHKHVIEVAVL